jgi:KipI family sensor histidine kinase inhibitor
LSAPPAALRLRPVGDAALTVELGEGIDPATNARVRALDRALSERPFAGLVEAVPTHRSLLVCFDPAVTSSAEAGEAIRSLGPFDAATEEPGRRHEIRVRYGGDDGPELEAVAARAGLSVSEVVALHSGRDYTAYMLGFLPGFAYLGEVPEILATPRLKTPRTRVPAGSLGIANRLTGVYPAATPGGWNLIGRAATRFFDPDRQPPSLLSPGDRVRFVPVERLEEPPPGPASSAVTAPLRRNAGASIEVISPGLMTTVQAIGRRGSRRFGVATSGPLDEAAHRRANGNVGNPADAATLECTVVGPTLRFLRPTHFALAGADLGATLERADLGSWPVPAEVPVLARPGNVLSFEARRSGCRAYVAFAGGIDVPMVLGSRATDLVGGFGGFGGRALHAADALGLGVPRGLVTHGSPAPGTAADDDLTVEVVLGPQEDAFAPEVIERFLGSAYDVGAAADRVGCRLAGPRLDHAGSAEIVSDGMVPGSIQVPPDGQPIVMLADGPTTGGYPKIATVVSRDLALLAQALPGKGRVRFAPFEKYRV